MRIGGGPIEQPQKNEPSNYDFSDAKEILQSMGGRRTTVAPLTHCTPSVGEMAKTVGQVAVGKIRSVIFGSPNPS